MAENKILFASVLDILLDESRDFPPRHLQHFSDLDPASLKALLETWPRVTRARKLRLLEGLLTLLDLDTLVSFDDLGRALLEDSDPAVRAHAIRLLAESDDARLVPALIQILQEDDDPAPRLEAAVLLGEFVMLGELEELPEEAHHAAEEALFTIERSTDPPDLRRRALEGLGYSSRPEVQTLIESAYRREDPEWVVSALTAMGRSSDEQWEDEVIGMLLNEDTRIRQAAAGAAGELSLRDAGSILLKMLEDEEDDDVTTAAIWSLSQIGGEDARVYLQSLLDEAEDDEAVAFLEDALDNLAFTEDLDRFDLLSLDADQAEAE